MSCFRVVFSIVICGSVVGPARAQGLFERALEGDLSDAQPDSEAVDSDPVPREAGEDSSTGDALGSLARTFELNGFVRGDLFVGKAVAEEATDLKAGYAEAGLKLRARAAGWGDAFGEIRFLAGAGQGETKTEVSLREAYLNLYLGPVDIRLGHQIIAWGRADGNNPTDNLTPRDMNIRSANADDRRLANLALRLRLDVMPAGIEGSARVELVWVPFYAASRFPSFTLAGPMSFGPPNQPDFNLLKGIGALKLDIETPLFDASVSGLVGHSTFPGIELQRVLVPPDPVTLVLGFSSYRHVVVGFDFSTSVFDWFGLRGEAAFRWPLEHPARDDVPLPDLQYVVGVDREITDSLTIGAQYIGRYVIDWRDLPTNELLSSGAAPTPEQLQQMQMLGLSLDEIAVTEIKRRVRIIHGQKVEVSHAAGLRVSWLTLHETLTLELYATFNFSTQEILLRPTVTYNISDAFTVVAGGEIYGGPDDTLFGMADEILSAGFAELRLSF